LYFAPKLKIEVAVRSHQVDVVIDAISGAAQRAKSAAARSSLSDLRIRTSEVDNGAV
jgi:nitrogen regulatory protein PII